MGSAVTDDHTNPAKDLARVVANATNGPSASEGAPEGIPEGLRDAYGGPDSHVLDHSTVARLQKDFTDGVDRTKMDLEGKEVLRLGTGHSSVAAMRADTSGSPEDVAKRLVKASEIEAACAKEAQVVEMVSRSLAAVHNGSPLSPEVRGQLKLHIAENGGGEVFVTSRGTAISTGPGFSGSSASEIADEMLEVATSPRDGADRGRARQPESYLDSYILEGDPLRIEAVIIDAGFATVSGQKTDMVAFIDSFDDPVAGVEEVIKRLEKAAGDTGPTYEALRALEKACEDPARIYKTQGDADRIMEAAVLSLAEQGVNVKIVDGVVLPDSITAPVGEMLVEFDKVISELRKAREAASLPASPYDTRLSESVVKELESAAREAAGRVENAIDAVGTAVTVYSAVTGGGVVGPTVYASFRAEQEADEDELRRALNAAIEDATKGAYDRIAQETNAGQAIFGGQAAKAIQQGLNNKSTWSSLPEVAVTVASPDSSRKGRKDDRSKTAPLGLPRPQASHGSE